MLCTRERSEGKAIEAEKLCAALERKLKCSLLCKERASGDPEKSCYGCYISVLTGLASHPPATSHSKYAVILPPRQYCINIEF